MAIGMVTWFDEYSPKTNTWQSLTDAPHARDHISVTVYKHKLYVIGGRRTTAKTNNVLNIKEAAVDIFDFKSHAWSTLPASSNLPTLRAGANVIAYKGLIIVIGGESDTQVPAHADTEALNIRTLTWTKLPDLHQGRHGTGSVRIKNKIYIIGGVGNRGGSPELGNGEILVF